jgi:hypothetical protein
MVTSTQIRIEHDQVLDAAEQMLRAQRQLGALLARAPLRRGGRPGSLRSRNGRDFLSLDEAGVSRHHSSKYQRLARIDERRFEKYLAEARAAGVPATTVGALRTVRGPSTATTPKGSCTRRAQRFDRLLARARRLARDFGLAEMVTALRATDRLKRDLDGILAPDALVHGGAAGKGQVCHE